MNTTSRNTSNIPSNIDDRLTTGSATRRIAIAIGLGAASLLAVIGAVVVTHSGGSEPGAAGPGDDVTREQTAAPSDPTVVASEPTTPTASTVPAVPASGPVESSAASEAQTVDQPDAPATTALIEDSVSEPPARVVEPAPEVVVGTDPDGNDIVVVFEISSVCATTHHEQFGDQPSFIRWVYDAPGLEDGTDVVVLFNSDGSARRQTTVQDHRVVAEQGIDAYGTYQFPSIEWSDAADTTDSIQIDRAHTVDDKEGAASKTCVS